MFDFCYLYWHSKIFFFLLWMVYTFTCMLLKLFMGVKYYHFTGWFFISVKLLQTGIVHCGMLCNTDIYIMEYPNRRVVSWLPNLVASINHSISNVCLKDISFHTHLVNKKFSSLVILLLFLFWQLWSLPRLGQTPYFFNIFTFLSS